MTIRKKSGIEQWVIDTEVVIEGSNGVRITILTSHGNIFSVRRRLRAGDEGDGDVVMRTVFFEMYVGSLDV